MAGKVKVMASSRPVKKIIESRIDILEKRFCTKKELDVLKDYIAQGAVFIVLGSEYTYTRQFYKGLHQIMVQPTYNGACIYDAYINYSNAFERPYVVVTLNDICNRQKIDSIKLLRRYSTKSLYKAEYASPNEGV